MEFLGDMLISLGDFLWIQTPNTGQLNTLFHTFAEFRLIVNKIVAQQSTDWLAANAQFSPNYFNIQLSSGQNIAFVLSGEFTDSMT